MEEMQKEFMGRAEPEAAWPGAVPLFTGTGFRGLRAVCLHQTCRN